jgi:hypothetical protein
MYGRNRSALQASEQHSLLELLADAVNSFLQTTQVKKNTLLYGKTVLRRLYFRDL